MLVLAVAVGGVLALAGVVVGFVVDTEAGEGRGDA